MGNAEGTKSVVISVIDPTHPIDYSTQETPPNYKCGECGGTRCKLWREWQTWLHHQTLRCARCAAKDQKLDISDMDQDGRYSRQGDFFPGRKTDQIGWYVPAVPTAENDTYWGYASVPEEGVAWWYALPTFPS